MFCSFHIWYSPVAVVQLAGAVKVVVRGPAFDIFQVMSFHLVFALTICLVEFNIDALRLHNGLLLGAKTQVCERESEREREMAKAGEIAKVSNKIEKESRWRAISNA